ncbi:uncharacterized protein MYCFIDRAFT_59503 [Pseudocercospora fijiensis CIRAD86]|uniref:Cytochrome P450 monooxygenase n=1 Tax=Pseudocercospora fijiensis (strain CIRAD86) TaxID=383855 RepID=M3AYS6_PSEFD|nr:uncharacterized protein MYCFIDRAFT_59503 [Pseudocercospora fijiensis CIRAD86]EME82347.1 hypothetical protein MYCFIDRAFT_59503 [Pseudocercospora fijiensis CIRAD86]
MGSASGLLIPAAVLFFSYYFIGAIISYRRLSQFKGPPLASFSRFWLFWKECAGQLPRSQVAALEQYGSPARIGHDLVVTDDADLIMRMNAPASKWTRSGWYDAMRMDPRRDSVFSARDEKLHAELKSKEAGAYNGRDIASLEPDMEARIGDLIELLRKHEGTSVDFASVARYFTLDVLSTLAFGRPFGFMAADEDLWEYNKTSRDFMLILGLTANHSPIRWLLSLDWVQALAAPKLTDKTGLGPALAFARKAVAERFGPDAKVKKDMLGSFVEQGLPQLQCEAESFLQIIAGSDSTTTALRSCIFLLAGSPRVYCKLRHEVDAASSQAPTGSVIKYAAAQKLPYLKAVIQEALRLFPPLFGLKEKTAPPGGEEVGGIFFPEGTGVAICDDAVCRKKDIFGEDAHIFRPERFLEKDEALNAKRFRTVDVIFGTGRFQCLGKHIATMELHKSIFEIMRHFDFVMTDPMRGIDSVSHNIHMQSNMNLVMYSRT